MGAAPRQTEAAGHMQQGQHVRSPEAQTHSLLREGHSPGPCSGIQNALPSLPSLFWGFKKKGQGSQKSQDSIGRVAFVHGQASCPISYPETGGTGHHYPKLIYNTPAAKRTAAQALRPASARCKPQVFVFPGSGPEELGCRSGSANRLSPRILTTRESQSRAGTFD